MYVFLSWYSISNLSIGCMFRSGCHSPGCEFCLTYQFRLGTRTRSWAHQVGHLVECPNDLSKMEPPVRINWIQDSSSGTATRLEDLWFTKEGLE